MTPGPAADRTQPLPTRDPFAGSQDAQPLVVTRLESPTSGITIEGRFSLGWMGRLTPEQLELVGLLLARRNNLQRLATDLDISYNTARNRFEDIVAALGGTRPASRAEVLRRVEAGELTPEEGAELLG